MSTHPKARVPERLFDDPTADERWRARFRAARVSLPGWARDAADRSLYVSNASGTWELYAWDRTAGTHRQITDRPNGTFHGTLSPDGREVWWFDDTDGDEFGSWQVEPFVPGEKRAHAAVPGAHPGYPAGLGVGHDLVTLGMSTDDGVTVWTASRKDDAEPTVVYRSEHDGGVAALSRDERMLAIAHSEHGDSRHTALRILRAPASPGDTATTVAEKWDGPGKGLDALGFSPVLGDPRLLVVHERRGREELLLWDVEADTETELHLGLPGEVGADWYPDGTALLIEHTHQARTTLHRYDLTTGQLHDLAVPRGTVGGASVRPDSTVEYSWSDAARPTVVRALEPDGTDRVLLEPAGPKAPGSHPVEDVFVPLGDDEQNTVHALIARPDGAQGPLPVLFNLHGGPHAADEDRFSSYRAVWLDAGFAVVEVNYRGSTGYGSAWRDANEGRPGLTELADVAAVHEWVVANGLADPGRCVVGGASWGGYLALLALGTQPLRWAAGIAGVPVADYVAAYEDEMEPLRAFDRSLFGGSPEDLPEVYRECSPITYVDEVAAPVLVLAGANDPRCPIRQIDNYLQRLAERGAEHEVYRYDAGHGSLVIAETLRQVATEVDFALRRVR